MSSSEYSYKLDEGVCGQLHGPRTCFCSLSLLKSVRQQSVASKLSRASSSDLDNASRSASVTSCGNSGGPSPSRSSTGCGVADLDRRVSCLAGFLDFDSFFGEASLLISNLTALGIAVLNGSRSSPAFTLRSSILRILDNMAVSRVANVRLTFLGLPLGWVESRVLCLLCFPEAFVISLVSLVTTDRCNNGCAGSEVNGEKNSVAKSARSISGGRESSASKTSSR